MSYHIVKLSNGEDIICNVHEPTSSQETSKVKISSPLKMDTIARTTSKAVSYTHLTLPTKRIV